MEESGVHVGKRRLDYSHRDHRMRYRNVYRCCPLFWKLVGRTYRDLDVTAGILFIIGSTGFAVVPISQAYQSSHTRDLDIFMIVSVILFLLAKFLLEIRAIYANLWKRSHQRPSAYYHLAIWVLIVAGLLFMFVPALHILNSVKTARIQGWFAFWSGWGFLIGTALFTWDGWLLLKEPFWTKVENLYFHGSFVLMLGSVFFVFTGFCASPVGSDYDSKYASGVKSKTSSCSIVAQDWLNGIGGILFFAGSVLFLIFALDEMKKMYAGPDPRVICRHQYEIAHPAHHEPRHLKSIPFLYYGKSSVVDKNQIV